MSLKLRLRSRARQLGPGLITGAADDDPSGIATYSQAGAQFGYAMLWTVVFTLPLMAAIQIVSARIGYVTRRGLTANMKGAFPRPVVLLVVMMLLLANTLNIAADIAAMAEALRLLVGGSAHIYAVTFGLACLVLQVFLPFQLYVRWLKWLTLALLAYVAVAFMLKLDWWQVMAQVVQPRFPAGVSGHDLLLMVVAVFGTTISPYLFFWQAAQEVEDNHRRPQAQALRQHPEYAAEHLSRIKADTMVGMTFSNVIALCIVVATAVTLNTQGITSIQTSSQAAEALRPVAGEFAFAIFALGIIGTGLLAVPVLAGSAAYAVSELYGWKAGLSRGFHEARGFYLIIMAATGIGTVVGYLEVDPIQSLVWSAIVNGVISVPIMAVLMWIGQSQRLMGDHTITPRHRFFGWAATGLMAVAVVVMLATSF
jgi:NRAMP (natural resistance-associated macrophage protein)-like metal ion transporter